MLQAKILKAERYAIQSPTDEERSLNKLRILRHLR
jgi:hypothetical protein